MKKVTRKITVDMSRKSSARVVFATQNDLNSRCLSITLTDDGKPYKAHKKLTATVNYKRSDGEYGTYLATVCDDGSIEYLISPTILMVAGQTECSVSLFNDIGNKLTSSSFVIDVAQTLYPEHELSEDPRLDFVDEMIAKLTAFQNDENARKETEKEREQSESERNEMEAVRESAEQAREQNESIRISSEDSRVTAEIQRVWTENQREYDERVRVAAENERKTAERARQAAYLNIDQALDAVLAIQNALIGGGSV